MARVTPPVPRTAENYYNARINWVEHYFYDLDYCWSLTSECGLQLCVIIAIIMGCLENNDTSENKI